MPRVDRLTGVDATILRAGVGLRQFLDVQNPYEEEETDQTHVEVSSRDRSIALNSESLCRGCATIILPHMKAHMNDSQCPSSASPSSRSRL
jgi:hypothetical protein